MAVANLKVSPLKSATLGILAVVLIIFVARVYTRGPKRAHADVATAVVAISEAADTAPAARPVARPRQPLPRVTRVLPRDPFSRGWLAPTDATENEDSSKEVSEEALTLQFTLTAGGEQATAVISGFVVRPGSTVAGYDVVRIEERQVVLRNAAGTRVLRMP
jgi:hypothetical protein